MNTGSPNPSAPNPLQDLRDIHLPEAISDFPIAWGWWLLLVIVAGTIAAGTYFYLKQRKENAVKRSALALLKQHYLEFQQDHDSQRFLQLSNQVLKRYCLTHYPQAVGLSGAKWAHFLVCYSQQTRFSDETLAALSEGLYQQRCDYNADDLYHACGHWLNNNSAIVITPEQGNLNV